MSLRWSRWDVMLFIGGMVMAELDLICGVWEGGVQYIKETTRDLEKMEPVSIDKRLLFWLHDCQPFWWATFIVGSYLGSTPNRFPEFTPGYVKLMQWVPEDFIERDRFWQAIGALMMISSIIHLKVLQKPFVTGFAQYFGRISYAFYIVHGPILHSFGPDFQRATSLYKNEELHIPSYTATAAAAVPAATSAATATTTSVGNPSSGPSSQGTSFLCAASGTANAPSPGTYSYLTDRPSESTFSVPQPGFRENISRHSVAAADASAIPGLLQPGRHTNDVVASSNATGVPAPTGGESQATSTTASSTMFQDTPHFRPASLCIGPAPMDSYHHYTPSDPVTAAATAAAATPQQGYPGRLPAVTPQGAGIRSMANAVEQSAYAMGHASQPSGSSSHQSPLGLADIRQDVAMAEEPIRTEDAELPSTWNSNYLSPWPLYALDWCKWQNTDGTYGKVAAASYLEDNHNYLSVFTARESPYDRNLPESERGLEFVKLAEASHSYPVTRVLWEPPATHKETTDLLATSGDHLRLWSLPEEASSSYGGSIHNQGHAPVKLSPLALLSNSKSPEHTAPITSLDWNAVSPSLIITSSIDTTCTIWDIPTLTAKTQLIAHDKEVFDVRFCANSVNGFVSCGADGSVRMFDLRSLDHIASPDHLTTPTTTSSWPPPLPRIATSPHDAFLLATFAQDSNIIRVLDTRQPGQALYELKGHSGPMNCIEWSPFRRGTLASGADDCLVCIWDLMNTRSNSIVQTPQPHGTAHGSSSGVTPTEQNPVAAWRSDFEVSNISWSSHIPSQGSRSGKGWLGVCSGRVLTGVAI
ncbi:hypothetical protein KEM54_006952 [Ascosphaera aggregata]|nr:hypothetical protein KEM54_006952 [Ascosphaera aggregata]